MKLNGYCGTCQFYTPELLSEEIKADWGNCRRYPPHPDGRPFPAVKAGETWCGEYVGLGDLYAREDTGL